MIKTRGFTLIELVIAVAIVGILAAIAFPAYNSHVTKTRRHDAMGVMMTAASAMERYRARNGYSYLQAQFSEVAGPRVVFGTKSPVDGIERHYTLSLVSDATSYTITATPQNAQAGNGVLTLTNTGVKTWANNPDGSNEWDDK